MDSPIPSRNHFKIVAGTANSVPPLRHSAIGKRLLVSLNANQHAG
jgi:hypothetical protein